MKLEYKLVYEILKMSNLVSCIEVSLVQKVTYV